RPRRRFLREIRVLVSPASRRAAGSASGRTRRQFREPAGRVTGAFRPPAWARPQPPRPISPSPRAPPPAPSRAPPRTPAGGSTGGGGDPWWRAAGGSSRDAPAPRSEPFRASDRQSSARLGTLARGGRDTMRYPPARRSPTAHAAPVPAPASTRNPVPAAGQQQ